MKALEPYQIEGARFLASRPIAYLADVMGLGKTAQLVRAADLVGADAVTVTCPAILCRNWEREYNRFSAVGLAVHVIRTGADKVPAHGVAVLSDALMCSPGVRAQLQKRNGVLICDEAHRLKSPRARRTKIALGRHGLRNQSTHTWLSSGTPIPNNASELYPFCAAAGLFDGPLAHFVSRYCTTFETAFGSKITGNKNTAELKALMQPLLLRRTFDDVGVQLPEMLPAETVYVDGDTRLLREIDDATLELIKGAVASGDWSLRDTPAIATARRIIGVAKASAVADLAALELDAGEPRLIIFGIHTDALAAIAERLAPYGCGMLVGDTPRAERERLETDFQNPDGATRVLVCNLTVAGAGLNLTAAARVIMAEWAWTPSENDQAIARAQRRGQTKRVRVSYVSIAGSIDKRVTQQEFAKRQRIAELV